MTTTISFDFDSSACGALRLAPREFAREMRIAAAVQRPVSLEEMAKAIVPE